MPAARNDVDWSAIAAQAAAGATHQEIADHWNLPLGTVKARCTREGWKSIAREIQAQKTGTEEISCKSGALHPGASRKSVSMLPLLGERSKLRAAKIGDGTLAAIQRKGRNKDREKADNALICLAPTFKTTVDALSKVHSWDSPAQHLTQVNVNVAGMRFDDSQK